MCRILAYLGTVLAVGRLDFAAMLVGQDPTAFRLRRRLAGAVPAARQQVRAPHGQRSRLRSPGAPGLPDVGYVCAVPSGRTLVAEGAPSDAYYLTINGAVEKVLARGDRRIRVGLAGRGWPSATRASSTVAQARTPSPECSSRRSSATCWPRCDSRCARGPASRRASSRRAAAADPKAPRSGPRTPPRIR